MEHEDGGKNDLFIQAIYFGYCTCCEAIGPVAQLRKDREKPLKDVIEEARFNWNSRREWKKR